MKLFTLIIVCLLALVGTTAVAEATHRCWHKQNTCEPPPPPPVVQCNDGVDNSDPEDTLIDMADPGCAGSTDNDETNTVAPPPPPPPDSGTVLFDDQFTGAAGAAPNPAWWHRYDYCDKWTAAGRALQNCNLPQNAVLNGQGQLAITAKYAPGHVDKYGTTGYNYTTGRVESGKRWTNTALFGFKYGTASAWMKLPKAQGAWTGFWMLNLKNAAGQYGEIDVVEYLGREADGIHHANVHMWPGNVAAGGKTCDAGIDLSQGFHKYTTKWSPGQVDILLDDRLCYTAYKSAFSAWYLDDMPAIILLSYDVDGWGGAPDPAQYPSTMLVDRVLVTR